MPRPSGGYAAGYVTPVLSANAAAGVWTPRDLYANRAAGTWPVVGTATPAFSTAGYTRLWGLTTKSSGLVTGTAAVDTLQYDVKWWDGTISKHLSGDTFSKAAAGGYRAFEVYPVRRKLTDLSSNAFLASNYGNVTLSSAQSKFGGYSALFANNVNVNAMPQNYLAVPPNAALSLGTGDFTVECWVRFLTIPPAGAYAQYVAFAQSTDDLAAATVDKWWFGFDKRYTPNRLSFNTHAADNATHCAWAPNVDQWYHVAYVRESGVSKFFIDGVSQTVTNPNMHSGRNWGSSGLAIGAIATPSFFNGYMDDFRIVKGTAVYTSTFSPPTAALTPITNTLLLYNFDTEFSSTPTGQFDGFDVSSNDIIKLRGESLIIDRGPGANQWVQTYVGYPYYSWQWVQQWQAGPSEFASLKNNNLAAADLDQFYTDLGPGPGGGGVLNVQGNPGVSADTPSIATAKAYTVFGSVPPATTLLLNCEGANNGTTITDSSVIGHSIRRLFSGGAGPVTSTTQFKYGSSSVLFSGNNWLDNHIGNSANVLNTENFTIEMWVYLASRGLVTPIFELDLYTTGILWRVGSNSDNLWIKNTYYNWSPATHVPLSTWTHVALVRENDNVRVYAGGVQRLSAALPANTVIGTAGKIVIGASTHDSYAARMTANSYLDDIRLTRGLALYTGTFTPPTAQLTAL